MSAIKPWVLMIVVTASFLGLIFWALQAAANNEQDEKQHCSVAGGVYFRQYKTQSSCLQIIDGKLKEIR